MVILFHIIVALSSILYTAFLYFSPKRNKFVVSSTLIAATVISGTYLAITTHSHIVSTCIAGLIYFAIVLPMFFAASTKLATSKVEIK